VEDLTALPAHRLAALLAGREVSAAEVVAAHLERIERVNPRLNAVVQLAPDALERARAADHALAAGQAPGPLHGVPFTAKDNLETAGVVTAIGVPERAATVPAADATAVARLRAAGGILLGKTNCPPWGGGLETGNPVYGRTVNPWDPARTPGGSSGGEAAAVAAGLSPCGLGTDSGGSLRVPAHFCGVATLKPTAGLVPVTGVVDDEGPIGALSDPRTQLGPIARTVADLGLLLAVLAGPDGHDAGVAPVPPGDPATVRVEGLRVALHAGGAAPTPATVTAAAGALPAGVPTPGTAATVTAAAGALAAAGARVEEATPPGDGHALTREVWRSYRSGGDSLELYRLLRRWDRYRAGLLEWMTAWDAVLTPVYDRPAPPHGATETPELRDAVRWTTPWSLTGWPCAVVRCGTSSEGLPIGVQVITGPWHDHVALAVAACLEAALGGWHPPPL
jgi:amidase